MSKASILNDPGSVVMGAPPSTVLRVEFALRQTVYIDNATDVRVTITAFSWRGSVVQAEVSWFHNGSLQTAWVDIDRLNRFS